MSDELRIAVPRGALFTDTLDLLDRLGIDTSEVRENDRKLLFEDAGIVTMRPSDVPTYVEAGAADIGITGKDVLMEQSEREVYELVDLGYGRCPMVLATVAGEDRAAEALRRLGVMRIATKYPKIAARYFLETGRQAEIVEVKGSVELAPLTGLVEGIVDLTATGTTLRENGLVDPRGDRRLHRAADRQPGRAQAQGVGHRRAAGAARCGVSGSRLTGDPAAAGGAAPRARARRRRRSSRPSRRSSPRCATGGDEAVLDYTRRFDTGGASRAPLDVRGRAEPARARDGSTPPSGRGLEQAIENVGAVAAEAAAQPTSASASTLGSARGDAARARPSTAPRCTCRAGGPRTRAPS